MIRATMTIRKTTGVVVDMNNTVLAIAAVHLLGALYLYLFGEGQRLRQYRKMRDWHGYTYMVAKQVLNYVKTYSEPRNPDLSLKIVENFVTDSVGTTVIHVGPEKGHLLDTIVERTKPSVVMEMGAYFGYSSVRMARLLKRPGDKVFTAELNPGCYDVTTGFVKFCGLQDRVEIFLGTADALIAQFRVRTKLDHVDLVFIDHHKPLYLADLKHLEKSGLMRPGTVVIADNIINPGVPGYLDYVVTSPLYTTTLYPFQLGDEQSRNGTVPHDAVAVSVYKGDKSA